MTFEVTDILALIKGEDVPGDNWRIIAPFTRLRQTGVNARWAWGDDHQFIPTDPERTILVVRLQTGTDEATIDNWLAERRPKVRAIVYEYDDVLWGDAMVEHLTEANVTGGKLPHQLARSGELARYMMSQCDGVIVSSEPLAAMTRPYTDRPVIVVPNALDIRSFRARMAYRPGWAHWLTIGWSGGSRPERDVTPMAQAWGRIAKRHPEARFVVAAPVIPDVIYREIEDEHQIIRLPWLSWHDYPVALQVSIGCASVSDTEFSRAKTPIKCWEGAVAGAAMIGSSTLYGPCLEQGGMTADTADEWENAIVHLIENPHDRVFLRDSMREHVEKHHNLDTQVHEWPAALSTIVDSMTDTREVAA